MAKSKPRTRQNAKENTRSPTPTRAAPAKRAAARSASASPVSSAPSSPAPKRHAGTKRDILAELGRNNDPKIVDVRDFPDAAQAAQVCNS